MVGPAAIEFCRTGKRQFDTEENALIELASINRENPKRKEIRAYHCSFCHEWHLTSQEKGVRDNGE
jgi:hypothetical protein